MPDLFDYLAWRGDLPISQVPLNAVDGLILSNLAYTHFDQLVPADEQSPVTLSNTIGAFLALPETDQGRTRCKTDFKFLRALARAPRFAPLRLLFYRDLFQPDKEMQFAAMAVLLDGGSALLTYRGTDSTLVGWKEDFNMSFQDIVPAQQAALEYLEQFAAVFSGSLVLAGHSKGGNLAVFAASQCSPNVRRRILGVYNNDGPGFTDYVLDSAGYQELLPRIHTFVPQSSVIGMLLEHKEAYSIVKSRQIGIFQHDPYSWEIMGGDFIHLDEVTASSQITNRAIKAWLGGMTCEERSTFVDVVFNLLAAGDASFTGEIMQPHNLYASLRAFKNTDTDTRQKLAGILVQLIHSTTNALRKKNRAD